MPIDPELIRTFWQFLQLFIILSTVRTSAVTFPTMTRVGLVHSAHPDLAWSVYSWHLEFVLWLLFSGYREGRSLCLADASRTAADHRIRVIATMTLSMK